MTNEWIEFNLCYTSVDEGMAIIDDALCYGFEFKVEKHKIYYREIV